jgi:serine/threonine-protein kinase BUR1
MSLLKELLKLNWRTRINAVDALEHPYFKTRPLPARPDDIPKFRDSHELDRRNNRGSKPKPPPAPEGADVPSANGERPVSRGKGNGWPMERGPLARDFPKRHEGAYDRGHGHRPNYDRDYHGSRMPAVQESQRRSGWQVHGTNEGDQGQTTLPPPPGEGRHQLPPAPHRSFNNKDTYIPSYAGERRYDGAYQSGASARNPAFDRDEPYRREHHYRPRNEYRDRDRDEGLHPNDRRDERSNRRTRSRSPEARGGWGAGHDRDRERSR